MADATVRKGRLLFALLAASALAACSGGGGDSTPVGGQTAPDTGPPATAVSDAPPATNVPVSTPTPASPGPVTEPPGAVIATPTPATNIPVSSPTPAPAPTATSIKRYSDRGLVSVDLAFRVRVPDNTPADGIVYVTTFATDAFTGVDHVALQNEGNGYWSGTVPAAPGSLLRYAYDRWDGSGSREVTAEGLSDDYLTAFRLLKVSDDMEPVQDVVGLWNDLRSPFDEGAVSGTVIDRETGMPVNDALISVGGVHSATDYDGTFEVTGLPAGRHHVIVYSATGEFLTEQRDVIVEPAQPAAVEFEVSPAEFVNVRFEADLPDRMPVDAIVKIAGNLRQLGGRKNHPTGNGQPDGTALPRMAIEGGAAVIDLDLPVGAFVSYTYTIGPIGLAASVTDTGATIWYSFVVGEEESERIDRVDRFGNPLWPLTTLNVTVPDNSTPGAPISFRDGPQFWLSEIGPNRWSTVIGNLPPGTEFTYGYLLGANFSGADGTSSIAPGGTRTITIGDADAVVEDVVTKWAGLPDPTKRQPDGSLDVTFRVSVPLDTPPDAEIILTGDRPALGEGVAMARSKLNPWLYEATVHFGHDGALEYRYQTYTGLSSDRTYTINTGFDGQVVNDPLPRWEGAGRPDERPDFKAGYYTPDFWSAEFETLGPPTFERIGKASGDFVAISSVWSYGQTQPVPTIEQYSFRAGSVSTPIESIREQAALAHQAGLRVFLAPQFNMEPSPGGFATYNGEKSVDWWRAWVGLAEKVWLWNAEVAEEIDAELLMLPGPLFHVFETIQVPDGDPFIAEFDARLSELVRRVQQTYSGQILISGGNRAYDFPGLANVNGTTTFDLGVPDLPPSTTVADWKAAYAANFKERIDPIHERWGNDVVFYTVHVPAGPTPEDPAGEIAQANRLEAIFQLMAERPWIKGAFSWSFDYIDAPDLPGDSQRSKLGEAVTAKWYDRLSGR